jgi:hypothetical protein
VNEDRIERELRQRGPRERGATLPPVPADLAAARVELSRLHRGRALRGAIGAGLGVLAAAAVVVVAIAVAATGPRNGPQVGDGASVQPSASAGIGECQASSLEATAEPWGAAAGSRGTMVHVTNTGSVTCTLSGRPGASIGDARLMLVVSTDGGTDPGVRPIELEPGQTALTSVVWSNWCGRELRGGGLSLTLRVGGDFLPVTPDASAPDILVPPCMGSDPTSLSTIDFQRP